MAYAHIRSDCIEKICQALGLGDKPIAHIVSDIQLRAAVMVYVEMFAEADQLDVVADLLRADKPNIIEVDAVKVDEKGGVTWKPKS